jgi:hypothetical protein
LNRPGPCVLGRTELIRRDRCDESRPESAVAFTLVALVVYVVGSDIPIPALAPAMLKYLFWGPEPGGFEMWM